MTGDDERGRRFSEREVGLIIKRATELQQTEPVESERSGGVSLAELEQIAREVGIDPSFIRRAATDLDTVAPSRASPLLGAPTVLRFERTINGEVPSTEFELLVLEIQKTLSQHGIALVQNETALQIQDGHVAEAPFGQSHARIIGHGRGAV